MTNTKMARNTSNKDCNCLHHGLDFESHAGLPSLIRVACFYRLVWTAFNFCLLFFYRASLYLIRKIALEIQFNNYRYQRLSGIEANQS